MDTGRTTMLIITVVSIILSALFSGMEIAFVSSNRVRVKIDVNKEGFINKIISIFYSHKEMFITSLLVGNNIMLVIYGMGMANLLEESLNNLCHSQEALVLVAQTLISTGIILVTGEFLPKTIFRVNPNDSLRAFSVPLFLSYIVLYPISLISTGLSKLLMKLFRIKTTETHINAITMGELDAYLQENIDTQEDEHKEVEREVKIFQNALDFSDTHLRDCVVPRNEIVSVDIDKTERDALSALFTKTGLSKIVVYREDIDNVVGYIHVSELFNLDSDWKECIKPVLYAPETMLANKMMQNLLKSKKSMAIVVDEFGGTSGLVTLEDLVEEIFGEIEDEHDRNKLVQRHPKENIYEFSGRMEIEEINEAYHLDLPDSDEYQTLAGYLLYNLEMIPAEGDTFTISNILYTVLKMNGARIELVRMDTSGAKDANEEKDKKDKK